MTVRPEWLGSFLAKVFPRGVAMIGEYERAEVERR